MSTSIKVMRKICILLVTIAGVLLLFSTLLTTANACMRYFADKPIVWADELSVYSVILPVFLTLPILEFSDSQLCINVVSKIVKSEIGQKIVLYIRGLITLGFTGVLSYYGILSAKNSFARTVVTPVLEMPKGAIYSIVIACYILAFLAWVLILLRKGVFEEC